MDPAIPASSPLRVRSSHTCSANSRGEASAIGPALRQIRHRKEEKRAETARRGGRSRVNECAGTRGDATNDVPSRWRAPGPIARWKDSSLIGRLIPRFEPGNRTYNWSHARLRSSSGSEAG